MYCVYTVHGGMYGKGSFFPIRIPVERRKVMNGKEPTKENAPSDREACYITKRNRFPRSENDDTTSTGMESVAPPSIGCEAMDLGKEKAMCKGVISISN